MAEMSAKFREMGAKVYVEADAAEAVRKSNEKLG
jgi:hypothetical protein